MDFSIDDKIIMSFLIPFHSNIAVLSKNKKQYHLNSSDKIVLIKSVEDLVESELILFLRLSRNLNQFEAEYNSVVSNDMLS